MVEIGKLNLYIFFFKATPVSYATIRHGDERLTELIKLTEENFKPEKAIVLTFIYNTQAALYLPDYFIYCPFPLIFSSSEVPVEAQNVYVSHRFQTSPKSYWIPTGFKIEPITLPAGIDTVVLWEKEIADYYQDSKRPLKRVDSISTNDKIYYFSIAPGERIYYNYNYLTVR